MNPYREYRIQKKIETGGSDRNFYRVVKNGKTFIFIQGKHMLEYLLIRQHMARSRVAVPRLYASYRDRAVVEDLGDRTLYQIAVKKSKPDRILYQRVLKELVKMQVDAARGFPLRRRYDADHIRWEQDYFRDFFLGQYSGLKKNKFKFLDRDFAILTRDVVFWNESFDGFFMHRDFQSQNIIFKQGRPRFIDFQSARIGPLTYDLASLLKDSYLTIGKSFEDLMINRYFDELNDKGLAVNKNEFMLAYRLAGLQRNMQALGAFANLALNRGKPFFRRHIPRAVFLLRSGLRQSPYQGLTRIMDDLPHEKI
jgi:aminoglycoside/choline kinase family phosphotransferase